MIFEVKAFQINFGGNIKMPDSNGFRKVTGAIKLTKYHLLCRTAT